MEDKDNEKIIDLSPNEVEIVKNHKKDNNINNEKKEDLREIFEDIRYNKAVRIILLLTTGIYGGHRYIIGDIKYGIIYTVTALILELLMRTSRMLSIVLGKVIIPVLFIIIVVVEISIILKDDRGRSKKKGRRLE